MVRSLRWRAQRKGGGEGAVSSQRRACPGRPSRPHITRASTAHVHPGCWRTSSPTRCAQPIRAPSARGVGRCVLTAPRVPSAIKRAPHHPRIHRSRSPRLLEDQQPYPLRAAHPSAQREGGRALCPHSAARAVGDQAGLKMPKMPGIWAPPRGSKCQASGLRLGKTQICHASAGAQRSGRVISDVKHAWDHTTPRRRLKPTLTRVFEWSQGFVSNG